MSGKLKMHISKRVCECLKITPSVTPEYIKSLLNVGATTTSGSAHMNLPLDSLQKQLGMANCNSILLINPDDIISKVSLSKDRANRKISFEVSRDVFVKDVLENISKPDTVETKKKVIVEYSSPNIAKPFHVGHLRSTITGNFIANINKFLGNDVVRLNYLGDWGTQFGMLKVGVDLAKLTDSDIQQDPLEKLYAAYVEANRLAETDPNIGERARQTFMQLERGELKDIDRWKLFTKYTIDELTKLYKRLGVTFDEYNFESMYTAREIGNVISTMEKKRLLSSDGGKRVAVVNDKRVPLVKSDGSMLYLTRDIAAAIDRYNKHKFDQMYYVVDNSQSDHFNSLQALLYQMDLPWAGRVKHVKFGRIRGMSTRKGNAVFLKDILNEAQELMQKNQSESPTTKVSRNDAETSDVLGVTCVIINDLKQRRQKDYKFEWGKALQAQGDTGIKLQYTHCRLHSLQAAASVPPAQECRPGLLEQPEVLALVLHLAQFHDVLRQAHAEMEACLLVVYLFHLCNHVSKALSALRVKDESAETATQRMLLFSISQRVLGQGMEVLGLQPLHRM